MAVITPEEGFLQRGVLRVLWETITEGDSGKSIEAPYISDKTVHFFGTFGSTTMTLQGSNDNAIWHTLLDPLGTAISLTADGMFAVLENPRYIRPLSTAGTSTDVDCILIGRAGVA